MNRSLVQLEALVEAAERRLDAAIDREFPAGTRVSIRSGRGVMYGQISGEARGGTVHIKHETSGRFRRVSYRQVEPA